MEVLEFLCSALSYSGLYKNSYNFILTLYEAGSLMSRMKVMRILTISHHKALISRMLQKSIST